MSNVPSSLEGRILVLAPSRKDGLLTEQLLGKAGIPGQSFSTLGELRKELEEGAGAILLPEESLFGEEGEQLSLWLTTQPPWSDIPILVLARQGKESPAIAKAMESLGNVTVLERPMRTFSLVSAAHSALRARNRQYQIRDHLLARESAESDLRLADERKDEFLATLAHELRNPLSPISHALQIIKLQGGLKGDLEEIQFILDRQVGHLVRLVDDLMEVSRITRGKIDLQEEDVDISECLFRAMEASKPLIDSQQHSLATTISENLRIKGDPIRLTQIFVNLINNAAKYMNPGGQIAISAEREGNNAIVKVSDSGVGISKDMLGRVFEMFAQIDGSKTKARGGLGIGLTLVKNLVEMHGGKVRAQSEGLGEGSVFTVSLPLNKINQEEQLGRSVDTLPVINQRILLADDNQDVAIVVSKLLAALGADVHTVYSGPDALSALEKTNPTVVILDIGMPGMDGYEVAKQIRNVPKFAKLPLVALTGWGQQEDRIASKEAGFDHHLVKPVSLGDLHTLLTRL